jgi:formate hydrogenlyase subunit 3/multisubunit Na+/H+ antiporter MnhD subunit
MILLPSIVLLVAAALCLGLSQRVPTRLLGGMAAGAAALAALLLVVVRLRSGAGDPAPLLSWVSQVHLELSMSFDLTPTLFPLALLLTGGGALALLALALALAPSVRGFGVFFALALLAVAAALAGLTSSGMLVAFLWILTVLLSYSAVWASGAYIQREHVSWGMVSGLLASLVLLGSWLVLSYSPLSPLAPGSTSGPGGVGPIGTAAAGGVLVACLMLVGSAPFHATLDEIVEAPAALGGLFYGVVFPVLALGTLLRFAEPMLALLAMPVLGMGVSWQAVVVLVSGGGLVACAAGALRETRLRGLLAWQASGQAAVVVLAIALEHLPVAVLLMMNLALTTLVGALAIEVLEYLTGSDDFSQELPEKHTPTRSLRTAGLLWALSGIAALGLPPFAGFWGKSWLINTAATQAPWVVPLVLAASGIVALAYLGPLARFWGGGLVARWHTEEQQRQSAGASGGSLAGGGSQLLFSLVFAPLLVVGVAPHLAWEQWLHLLPGAPPAPPVSATAWSGYVFLTLILVLVILVLWRLPWKRRTLSDPDMTAVVLAPRALAETLLPLAWMGRPTSLIRTSWEGLTQLSALVHILFTPFEKRYYLSGVVLVLISLIVLMALQ